MKKKHLSKLSIKTVSLEKHDNIKGDDLKIKEECKKCMFVTTNKKNLEKHISRSHIKLYEKPEAPKHCLSSIVVASERRKPQTRQYVWWKKTQKFHYQQK